MFEKFFFNKESRLGRQKARFLTERRVICLDQPHRPSYRLSWETIQALIKNHKQTAIEQMRKCEIGAHLADEFQKIECDSPEEILFTCLAEGVLPSRFPDYRPVCGFDADIFLVMDDEYPGIYQIEIFPRSKEGKMVRAYGSMIQFSDWLADTEAYGRFEYIESMLFVHAGETRDEKRSSAVKRWVSLRKGQWKLTDPQEVTMFVQGAAFSVIADCIFTKSTNMIVTGASRGIYDGVNREAFLRII